MPLFFADLVPGSDTILYQETLYRSESCKIMLRRTAPCGLPGAVGMLKRWMTQVDTPDLPGNMSLCNEYV